MKWWPSLFPAFRSCWFCSSPMRGMVAASVVEHICPVCREQLVILGESICPICGRFMPGSRDTICLDCNRLNPCERVVNRSAIVYTDLVKEWVQTFKYCGKESLALPMGNWMTEVVKKRYRGKGISLITYVPMHGERQRQRGFNQAERLAKVIGKNLWLPVRPLLQRKKATAPQSKRTRQERLLAVTNAFAPGKGMPDRDCSRQTVLIVDDVYTTGATIRACGRVLRENGFRQVFSVTFAR
ncbi:ComF family protein [Thermoactinomyces mirandus]|uniref:ComF family protein n=1 Tax=Thermoactinomyces mirandus TaxID=2756294 RepID=A0A7W1XUF7_9BACL|nr:ComF family protein [Thermoactinomyces mirandus]MBA4603483.1 ComF family protein [Thermoactinomyces mirandus]